MGDGRNLWIMSGVTSNEESEFEEAFGAPYDSNVNLLGSKKDNKGGLNMFM